MKRLLMCVLAVGLLPAAAALQFDGDPQRAATLRSCDTDRDRGRQAESRRCYQALANSAAPALVRAEAQWALGDLRAANELFRAAAAAAPRSVQPRLRWGRLYLAAHQYAEAAALFAEAQQLDANSFELQVAAAELGAQRFQGGAALEELGKLAAQQPQRAEPLLITSQLQLDAGDTAAAIDSATRALTLLESQQRTPLAALSALAAAELAAGRDPQATVDKALRFNPRYGDIHATLARTEIMRRRYREAAQWLQRAVQVEPDNWQALEELGVNQLRLGDADGARRALERAYAGDPFSATTVNTLRVLDTLPQYTVEQSSSPPLALLLHRKESAVLQPYVEQLARQAIASFSARYGWQPKRPIRIELYPNHDDFAVRTAGLPGIGLLGVTFGDVVAMDSPSGRRTGDFHWGSTLWHELAHVFSLSATDHRVPRWLSEGLSVFEEWRTGPTPGVAIEPNVLDAWSAGKLLPVARLDEGFMRPAYEGQVQVSYAQAGLVCLFIEQRHGIDKLVALLHQYQRDTTVPAAVQAALGLSSEAFDIEFAAFMKQRFAPWAADPKRLRVQLRAAQTALEKKDWEAATRAAREAVQVLPEYTGSASGYLLLAAARLGAGDKPAAIEALLAWRAAGGWDPEGQRQLVQLLSEAGREAEALPVRVALNFVDPLALADHQPLGEQLLKTGKPLEARREYRALLALQTQDPATAWLGLARAEAAAGNAVLARRHALQSLEIAPHFRPAQQFLLELRGEPAP